MCIVYVTFPRKRRKNRHVEVEVEVEVEGEDRSKGEEACEKKKWIVENVVFEKLTRD